MCRSFPKPSGIPCLSQTPCFQKVPPGTFSLQAMGHFSIHSCCKQPSGEAALRPQGLALSGNVPGGFPHLSGGTPEVQPGRSQSGAKPRFLRRGWGLSRAVGNPDLLPGKCCPLQGAAARARLRPGSWDRCARHSPGLLPPPPSLPLTLHPPGQVP